MNATNNRMVSSLEKTRDSELQPSLCKGSSFLYEDVVLPLKEFQLQQKMILSRRWDFMY